MEESRGLGIVNTLAAWLASFFQKAIAHTAHGIEIVPV